MPVLRTANEQDDNAKRQAIAQFHSIVEMVAAVRKAEKSGHDDARESAIQTINEDVLSVEVRSGWHAPSSEAGKPEEFRLLLCTGGPAVQIMGKLNEYGEPEAAWIEYQDWFRPWTRWNPGNSQNVESILLDYARTFYFSGF